MRICCRNLAYAVLTAVLAACGGSEPNPVPTTIQVQPTTTVNLPSIGATQQLTARVLDQNGDSMVGVTTTFAVTAGTSASVTTGGLVTALANGTTTITATAGSASSTVTVNVQQVPAQITKNAGDNQTGTVATALANALAARVVDALGNVIAGQTVTFAIASGGGQVGTATTQTNSGGIATSTWTLGQTAGQQTVTATAGTLAPITFFATANAGPAAAIAVNAGNNQTAATNTSVSTAPSVRVTDQFNNPKGGVPVTFAVTSGGGSTTPANGQAQTNPQGIASLTAWTMGSNAGPNQLTVTVNNTSISTTIGATAVAPGAPSAMAAFVGGTTQTALRGYETNLRPAVRVTDNGGLPVPGAIITFAVTGGGGSVTKGTDTTDANGVAQVGGWTVGVAPGSNSLTATAAVLPGVQVVFNANGVSSSFNVALEFTTGAPAAAVQQAFDNAVAFWQSVIIGDVADINGASFPSSFCAPAATRTIDDIHIVVRLDSIDGPGGVLGSAGPCFVRGGTVFSSLGLMRFDTADVANFVATNRFEGVVRHEMGHVLGIGTLWGNPATDGAGSNCRQGTGGPDPFFNCARALAAFDSLGGASYTGGSCNGTASNKVPVEGNQFSAGTRDGHWRECVFDEELMTGFAEAVGISTPISILTIASLEDHNYVVNYGAREPYSQTYSSRLGLSAAAATSGGPPLGDILAAPIFVHDSAGRVLRVILPR